MKSNFRIVHDVARNSYTFVIEAETFTAEPKKDRRASARPQALSRTAGRGSHDHMIKEVPGAELAWDVPNVPVPAPDPPREILQREAKTGAD
jgi:hypothetical protein